MEERGKTYFIRPGVFVRPPYLCKYHSHATIDRIGSRLEVVEARKTNVYLDTIKNSTNSIDVPVVLSFSWLVKRKLFDSHSACMIDKLKM
jgi:hypothetical protein